MIFSPLGMLNSFAVEYPAGVESGDVEKVIPKLEKLFSVLMTFGDGDIKKSLYDTLFSDKTLNSLYSAIYSSLSENADSLSVIGVDLSPASLAYYTSGFPKVSAEIKLCSDINQVVAASARFQWGVTNKAGFARAVSAMLAPFNALLNALLCSGSVKINSLISIKGDDGYTAAIVPLLKVLDCPDIMSSSDFATKAAANYSNITINLVNMLLSSIEKLLDNPVNGMCSTLPKIAYYLDSGKLSASITSLLEPLSLKIAGIFTIPGIADLITGVADLEGSVNINDMLSDIDLSKVLGSDVKLQIPEIDLKKLAECVTENGSEYTVDESAAFMVVMNFLLETVRLNENNLGALLGGTDLSGMLKPLLQKSNGEIIKTLITLLTLESIPANNYQWTFPTPNITTVTYTPNFGADDYAKFLTKVDPLLTDFVKESDPEGTIEKTLRETIYSNSLISTLVVTVFKTLCTEETAPLFALLGMDVSPAGVANSIASYYPYTAKYLYNFTSWEKVNVNYLTWGFYNGDSEGFTRALTRVLSPFSEMLGCVLAGGNINLFDAVTIPGSDGYNTAVIPLLEALGCNADKIKTYSEYKAGLGTDKIISDILTPVTALLDELCAAPVATACRILPNIVYFMNSGLLTPCIENIIYPVKYMLDTAGLGGLLDSAFSDMGKFDLNSVIGEMLSGTDLGIKLPELDIGVIGTLGTAVSLTSKRESGSSAATYTYLKADTSAVFLTIVRFLVSAISLPENSSLLTDLMGSGMSTPTDGPDMFAMFAGNIGEKFKNMTQDETVEWLCDLLFSDSPIMELPVDDGEIPTIIYEEKFELSATAKLVIVLGVIALAALVYYILSVSGKLDNVKLRRRKKKERKRRLEESKKLIKAGGVAVDALEEEKPVENVSKKMSSRRNKTDAEILEEEREKAKLKEEISEKKIKKIQKCEASNLRKDDRIARKKLPDEKESEKLMKRQQAAAKKAYKNEIKIQKQYEKAKRQAANRK